MVMAMTCFAKEMAIPVAERHGEPCVTISSLASHHEIAVKHLPGTLQWVACAHDRCGILKDVFREGDQIWVAVAALDEALGATAQFDSDKKQVIFKLAPTSSPAHEPAARVGSLVPNFRLARLDGSPVSLADFAGKRLLINSWGSW